jgi:hypothetical protein
MRDQAAVFAKVCAIRVGDGNMVLSMKSTGVAKGLFVAALLSDFRGTLPAHCSDIDLLVRRSARDA